MPRHIYSPLSRPHSIRLLLLLPREEDLNNVRCKLFEYPLRNWDGPSHPYEALSYVWGSEDKPCSILVNDRKLSITQNLYTLLLHLQVHDCLRTIWVDAICINQTDEKEKESQISFMAEIYAKASRVLVWLGEEEDNSDEAIEAIRLAGQKLVLLDDPEQAILRLLQRQWFQRIWVLQEVAAARHVSIMCGSDEIDGHAFCLGLDFLNIEESMNAAAFLIRGAIFRSRHIRPHQGRLSLDICSLGELVDMYHAHKATKIHDKIYALIGMCSGDLKKGGLEPDYELEWKILMQRLVRFVLGNQASATTYHNKEMAVIKSKGYILGKISFVKKNSGGEQTVGAIFRNTSKQLGYIEDGAASWTLKMSVKPVQSQDIICLFQGASQPTIIRLHENHFDIVVIAALPPKHIRIKRRDIEWLEILQLASFRRDFLLVWNWEQSKESNKCGSWLQTDSCPSEFLELGLGNKLNEATGTWNIALILRDLGDDKRAKERFQKAIAGYKIAIGDEDASDSQYGLTPLCWAAKNGRNAIVDLLLTKDNVDMDLQDNQYGRTPLSWAAENGHDTVVARLLATGKVNVDSKDSSDRTPLSWAAGNGHENVASLLVEGNATIDLNDKYGQTPFSYAAWYGHEAIAKLLSRMSNASGDLKTENIDKIGVNLWLEHVSHVDKSCQKRLYFATQYGHKAVVRRLLDTDKVDINLKDYYGRTPLLWAAKNGDDAIVRLLINTTKVDIDSKDNDGRTPLSWAAENGHEVVVRLLIDTGKVNVDSKDNSKRTPLSIAAKHRRKAVVRLLIDTCRVNADSKDKYKRTPLSWAAENGDEAMVRLLIDTSQIDIDSKDECSQTPLSWAALNGHEAVVRLLIDTSKVDVDSKDDDGRTPFSWAAGNGEEAVVKLLINTGKVDIDSKDNYGQTPLSWAAGNGGEDMARLLISTGKVDADSKDNYGRTPLSWAAENGDDNMVRLLMATDKVDIDSTDNDGRTPLSWAAENGHEVVVSLLQSSISSFSPS